MKHPEGSAYRPDIDGLRAVAILSVLGFHAFPSWAPAGFIGVDIFFVISGYLISGILLSDLEADRFSFAAFYARRIRRIFPALIVVLLASLIFGFFILWPGEYRHLARHAWGGAAFIVNIMLGHEVGYFAEQAADQPLLHLWSLGVEEQFYIFWPLMLWCAWQCRHRAGAMIALVIIISFAVNMWLLRAAPLVDFYSPFSRFWELLAGGALAFRSRRGLTPIHARQLREIFAVSGVILITAAELFLNRGMFFPGWAALVPVMGAVLIIAAGENTFINRKILSHPLLVGIGLISYPLYLWHWPLLSFAHIIGGEALPRLIRIAMIGAAFLLAMLTYMYIEQPLRKGGMKKKTILILLISMSLTGLGSATIYIYKGLPQRFADISSLASLDSDQLIEEWQNNVRTGVCHLQDPNDQKQAPSCIETIRPLLLLWGDSHAASLYPGLKDLQKLYPFGIAQLTQAGCPPLFDLPRLSFSAHCNTINQSILTEAKELNPALILLDAAWVHEDYTMPDTEIIERLRASVERIKNALPQSTIIVIGPDPRWQSPLPALYRRSLSFEHKLPPARMSAHLDQRLASMDEEMRTRLAESDIKYLSPQAYLCDISGCLTRINADDNLTFVDDEHISTNTAIFLAHKFAPDLLKGLDLK